MDRVSARRTLGPQFHLVVVIQFGGCNTSPQRKRGSERIPSLALRACIRFSLPAVFSTGSPPTLMLVGPWHRPCDKTSQRQTAQRMLRAGVGRAKSVPAPRNRKPHLTGPSVLQRDIPMNLQWMLVIVSSLLAATMAGCSGASGSTSAD